MTTVVLGFLLALADSGLGIGAILPGEVAISGLASGLHSPGSLTVLGAAAALGATTGDHLGLAIGHLGGTRLRESRVVRRMGSERWDRATDLLQRHGFWAVLASRVLPLVRTVMPAVAGAAGLRYRSFVTASVLGALVWSTLWVGAGAGIAATGVLRSPWLPAAAVLLVMAALVVRRLLRQQPTAVLHAPPWETRR